MSNNIDEMYDLKILPNVSTTFPYEGIFVA